MLLLAVGIPAAWGVDTDAIVEGGGPAMRGVKVGGVTISLGNVGMAIVAFAVCMVIARLVRAHRARPRAADRRRADGAAPIDRCRPQLCGVLLALVIGVGALGIDFTNLAIVLGALSVGIGLGLQNIANNVISGVILLVERPIKAGDWVTVSGHEGFVRRINIRATEIETFQRTHVIMPNSAFLQNPVVNRTYADTSSRVEIKLTVGLATDVAVMEGLLREAALGHPRVLRVPAPIVRFVRITPSGLDFELFVFVAPAGRPAGRRATISTRRSWRKMIELGIVDPSLFRRSSCAASTRRRRRASAAEARGPRARDGDAAAAP